MTDQNTDSLHAAEEQEDDLLTLEQQSARSLERARIAMETSEAARAAARDTLDESSAVFADSSNLRQEIRTLLNQRRRKP